MKAEDFRIVTIPEAEIDPSCLVCAFPFMVEYIGHGIPIVLILDDFAFVFAIIFNVW